MGLFDRFKKKKNKSEEESMVDSTVVEKREVIAEEKLVIRDDSFCKKALEKMLAEIAELGFHELKIEEFRKKGLEYIEKYKKEGKDDDYIIKEVRFFIFVPAKDSMDNALRMLDYEMKYIDSLDLSDDEKKERKDESLRLFDYKNGMPVDFNLEIEKGLNRLRDLGYYDAKIEEFRDQCLKIIESGREKKEVTTSLPDVDILYKINHFIERKSDEIKKYKDALEREIEYMKSNPDFSKKDISDAYESYNLKVGKPFDIEQRIKDYLSVLQKEGYGESKLRDIKSEMNYKIDKLKSQNTANNIILYEISNYFDRKIQEIQDDKKLLADNIDFINSTKTNESSLIYGAIYGSDVIDERVQASIDIATNKFKIKYGNDCMNDLLNSYMRYFLSYGFSEKSYETYYQKVKDNSYRANHKDLDRAISRAVTTNDRCATLLYNHLDEIMMFANVYYGNDSDDNALRLIRDFLSVYGDERKAFCSDVDKKYLDYLNNNREKSNLSSYADNNPYTSDFVRKSLEMDDKLNDQLYDISNGSTFTEWLTLLNAQNSVHHFSKFGRRKK